MLSKKSVRKGILAFVGLAVALSIGVRLSFLVTDRIAPGICAGQTRIGGLTRAEAKTALKNWSRQQLTGSITLTAGDKRWIGVQRDIGIKLETNRMVDEAYSVGRKGSLPIRYICALWASGRTTDIQPIYRIDRDKIDDLVEKIDSQVASPAKDARVSFDGGARTISPEAPGTKVDPTNAYGLIKSAVESGRTTVMLPIVVDTPKVTTADLQQVDTLLARYTTRFPAWRKERTHNVRLATNSVNGKLLKPGDVFSYNETVGPRLKKNGFQDAFIYVKGKMIPGTGGGICQVSSTVYNAALLANLDVIERSNHSMPVPYVPLGRDATVAYGLRDLKFKNTTSAPIYMTAQMVGSHLTVDIYGASRDKRDVSIITTPPKKVLRPSGTILTTVTVYRVVRSSGTEAQKERLSYDKYLPPAPHPDEKPKPHPKASIERTQA